MHTWTTTLPRETAVGSDRPDHLTVTTGLGPSRVRGRTVAAAAAGVGVAVLAALAVGGVLTSSEAAGSGPAVAVPQVHSRFGPVVHPDSSTHPRLGPVVRHSALPLP